MSRFYVYAHYTQDTDELFYIGKGCNHRLYDTFGRSDYWKRIVNKHGFESKIIIDNLDEPDAFIQEILAIKEFNPKANFTKGGSGGYTGPNNGFFKPGHKPWNTGKKCLQISLRQLGSKNHRYNKPSPNREKIVCENNQRIFDSIDQAAAFFSVGNSNIRNHLLGNTRTVRGFVFRYLNKPEANIKALKKRLLRSNKKRKQKKKIVCLETDRVYYSILECSKQTNLQPANITKVLQGKRNHTKGFTFCYV